LDELVYGVFEILLCLRGEKCRRLASVDIGIAHTAIGLGEGRGWDRVRLNQALVEICSVQEEAANVSSVAEERA
jgi:hypothetical protein